MAHEPETPGRLTAIITEGAAAETMVVAGSRLARALGLPWEAIFIETADDAKRGDGAVADALALAAKTGGTIATVPAATLLDGIVEHLRNSPATHLAIARDCAAERVSWRATLADAVMRQMADITLHQIAIDSSLSQPATPRPSRAPAFAIRDYALAVLSVLVTLALAEALRLVASTRSLDLIFLFPVIGVAARLGLRPALLAAALSVFAYNYFLLAPALSFDLRTPQNWVMSVVFFAAAAYTSIVTDRMRGRLLLSDRSARENASLAALAQRLTRDSDWETTAATLCEHVHALLDLQAIMFREVDGALVMAAAVPPANALGPIDQAALDWCWSHGEEAGSGTAMVSAANWQFHPLKTSLGMLAVLGVAREDGRDPVRADRRVLLSTIIAQAALAHERLRLEDDMRAAPLR